MFFGFKYSTKNIPWISLVHYKLDLSLQSTSFRL